MVVKPSPHLCLLFQRLLHTQPAFSCSSPLLQPLSPAGPVAVFLTGFCWTLLGSIGVLAPLNPSQLCGSGHPRPASSRCQLHPHRLLPACLSLPTPSTALHVCTELGVQGLIKGSILERLSPSPAVTSTCLPHPQTHFSCLLTTLHQATLCHPWMTFVPGAN